MVIVFLKSLIFERLSFRFLQQEKKVVLEIKNSSFTQRLLLLLVSLPKFRLIGLTVLEKLCSPQPHFFKKKVSR